MHCTECYEDVSVTDRFCPACGTPLVRDVQERVAIPPKLRFQVLQRDSFQCRYCGRGTPDVVLHVDHIIPVSRGGQNEITNLVAACADCNLGKGADLVLDSSDRVDDLVWEEWHRIFDLIDQEQDDLVTRQDDEDNELHERHMREFARLSEKHSIETDRHDYSPPLYARQEIEAKKQDWRHQDETRELEVKHRKEKQRLAAKHIELWRAFANKPAVRKHSFIPGAVEESILRCRDWSGDLAALNELVELYLLKRQTVQNSPELLAPVEQSLLFAEIRLAIRDEDLRKYPDLIRRIDFHLGKLGSSDTAVNVLQHFRSDLTEGLKNDYSADVSDSYAVRERVAPPPPTQEPLLEFRPTARRGFFRRR